MVMPVIFSQTWRNVSNQQHRKHNSDERHSPRRTAGEQIPAAIVLPGYIAWIIWKRESWFHPMLRNEL
jgi:hypothetical protein